MPIGRTAGCDRGNGVALEFDEPSQPRGRQRVRIRVLGDARDSHGDQGNDVAAMEEAASSEWCVRCPVNVPRGACRQHRADDRREPADVPLLTEGLVGRLLRAHGAQHDTELHDYVDKNINVLVRMPINDNNSEDGASRPTAPARWLARSKGAGNPYPLI